MPALSSPASAESSLTCQPVARAAKATVPLDGGCSEARVTAGARPTRHSTTSRRARGRDSSGIHQDPCNYHERAMPRDRRRGPRRLRRWGKRSSSHCRRPGSRHRDAPAPLAPRRSRSDVPRSAPCKLPCWTWRKRIRPRRGDTTPSREKAERDRRIRAQREDVPNRRSCPRTCTHYALRAATSSRKRTPARTPARCPLDRRTLHHLGTARSARAPRRPVDR